jgi:hypothetical protein
MRKQYHFRPGGQGLDAWDVDRLVRLSAELPVSEVPVDSIPDLDTAYWALPGSAHPTVREIVAHLRLVLDTDPSYPVILASDGRLMDGMHRVARALLEGRATVPAVRFPVDPEPDFRNCHPDELSYEEDTGG